MEEGFKASASLAAAECGSSCCASAATHGPAELDPIAAQLAKDSENATTYVG
jgi:hypothetical protein